jgi:hypothetical protein
LQNSDGEVMILIASSSTISHLDLAREEAEILRGAIFDQAGNSNAVDV